MRGYTTSLILIAITSFFILSCNGGGDDGPEEPTAQELTFENLAGLWGLPATGGIIVDGVDRTLNYEGFNLSFSSTGYTTTNAGTLFRATGTWSWASESTTTQINLDDGKTINIQDLSTTRFVFTFTKSVGSVRAGVAGNYTITVNK
jgi:hypothetical protein